MRAKTILLLLIALLFTSVVSAQTRYPKREFRGAWIQCVNGQFQGMPTEKIQRLLINQLNSLQGAGINAIIFQSLLSRLLWIFYKIYSASKIYFLYYFHIIL